MTKSVQERINLNEAIFKWVQYTPVGHLKDLNNDDLEIIRQQLIKEVREVGRALHWIDGIIKLKAIENREAKQISATPNKEAES